jgi:hypothetical protein
MADKKPLPNVKALKSFRMKGRPIQVGEVVAKEAFADKNEWLNLCHMTPAVCEETDEAVGNPKGGKGGMPTGSNKAAKVAETK